MKNERKGVGKERKEDMKEGRHERRKEGRQKE